MNGKEYDLYIVFLYRLKMATLLMLVPRMMVLTSTQQKANAL